MKQVVQITRYCNFCFCLLIAILSRSQVKKMAIPVTRVARKCACLINGCFPVAVLLIISLLSFLTLVSLVMENSINQRLPSLSNKPLQGVQVLVEKKMGSTLPSGLMRLIFFAATIAI